MRCLSVFKFTILKTYLITCEMYKFHRLEIRLPEGEEEGQGVGGERERDYHKVKKIMLQKNCYWGMWSCDWRPLITCNYPLSSKKAYALTFLRDYQTFLCTWFLLHQQNCGSIAYTVYSNFCMNIEVYVHCCWKFCKSHNMGHCVIWDVAGSTSHWQVKDFNPLEEIGLGTHFDIPWRHYCLCCCLWTQRQHKCLIHIFLCLLCLHLSILLPQFLENTSL